MTLLAIIIILDAGRPSSIEHRRFDVIELNHRYDETGRHCYSQIIVWNWKPEVRKHHVEAWWLVDADRLSQLPRKTNGKYLVLLKRSEKVYEITAPVFRETRTVEDPERIDKEHWHETRRSGL
jgi:hypothetical protein